MTTEMTQTPAGPGPRVAQTQAVRRSLAYCRQVTRRRARNFYYGLKLLPEPKRSSLYAIYAFMRACDDLADDAAEAHGAAAGLEQIESFRAQMVWALGDDASGPPTGGELWQAMRYACDAYPVDIDLLHLMLDGQRCDLEKQRYESFAELRDYCYKVASVVGLVCVSIWGDDGDPQVRQMAEHRGIALQLTNILRDLVEDAQRGRVYLPGDELQRCGLSADQFVEMATRDQPDARFDALMEQQLERVESYYEKCSGFDVHISADCRATSLTILRIYRALFDKIKAAPRCALHERVRLSSLTKLRIAVGSTWPRRG